MESLHVYPNPGNGVFYVSSPMPIANLSLTNMVGQLINTYQPISTFFELNISDKPCGVYFIKVDYGGKTQVLRVIKE